MYKYRQKSTNNRDLPSPFVTISYWSLCWKFDMNPKMGLITNIHTKVTGNRSKGLVSRFFFLTEPQYSIWVEVVINKNGQFKNTHITKYTLYIKIHIYIHTHTHIYISPKSLQMVSAAMKLNNACFLEEKLWQLSTLKSRDITFPTKARLVKAMVYPVVMYGCES